MGWPIYLESGLESASHQAYSKELGVAAIPFVSMLSDGGFVDHVLFCYPQVVWIWRLAGLLHGISSFESLTQVFLDRLRYSLESEVARLSGIHAAYVSYHI